MSDQDNLLASLARMEQNQLKALELQAAQVALVQAQMERAEARVQETVELQKRTLARAARITNTLVPVILLTLGCVVYFLLKNSP